MLKTEQGVVISSLLSTYFFCFANGQSYAFFYLKTKHYLYLYPGLFFVILILQALYVANRSRYSTYG